MRRSSLNTVWNPRGDNEATHPPYGLLGEDRSKCQSPSLRLEKYVRLGDNSKKGEIDAVVKCHSEHAKPIPAFEPKGAVPFVAKLRSRLIVNQAGGILENAGLCLHPHFGAPYIPGSAVKGIARHAAWCEWNEETDETEKNKIATGIAEVFGYPTNDSGLDSFLAARGWKDKTRSGSVAFLPAVPTDAGRLSTDIVNCHHPDYYGGRREVATDDESPNPQFFPTVDEGVSFLFSIVPVRPSADVEEAKGWLVRALSENGAGAKTAAGYGWFDCDPALTDKWRDARMAERASAERKARKEAFSNALSEWEKKSNAELSRPALDALAKELHAIGDESFWNANIGGLNALRKRLPLESPLDVLRANWESQRDNPVSAIGNDVASFENLPAERKELVCRLLWEASGIGAEFRGMLKNEANWPKLKPKQRDGWRKGLLAVRNYAKTTLQMGKMP